jgi:hypothetical protein
VALEAAFEAALAASDVVEAWRTAMRPIWGVRRSIREAEKDMMKTGRSGKGTTRVEKGLRVRGLLARTAHDALSPEVANLQVSVSWHTSPFVSAPHRCACSFAFCSTSPPSTLSCGLDMLLVSVY